jgi:hypothetical protein
LQVCRMCLRAQRRDSLPNRFGAIGRRRWRHAGIRGDDCDDHQVAGRIFRLAAADDLIDQLSGQPWKVHPARIGNLALDHAGAVGGDDLAEFRNRELLTLLGNLADGAEPATPIAAVASNLKDRDAPADLAKGDVSGRHSNFRFPLWRLRRKGAINRPPTRVITSSSLGPV